MRTTVSLIFVIKNMSVEILYSLQEYSSRVKELLFKAKEYFRKLLQIRGFCKIFSILCFICYITTKMRRMKNVRYL